VGGEAAAAGAAAALGVGRHTLCQLPPLHLQQQVQQQVEQGPDRPTIKQQQEPQVQVVGPHSSSSSSRSCGQPYSSSSGRLLRRGPHSSNISSSRGWHTRTSVHPPLHLQQQQQPPQAHKQQQQHMGTKKASPPPPHPYPQALLMAAGMAVGLVTLLVPGASWV
jgi:hypothetical protein